MFRKKKGQNDANERGKLSGLWAANSLPDIEWLHSTAPTMFFPVKVIYAVVEEKSNGDSRYETEQNSF